MGLGDVYKRQDLACTGKRLKAEADSPATGVVYDRMFVRHWDAWNDGRLNRVFVATLPGDGAAVSTATAIASDVVADIPSRPFGDSSEYTWAPDGQSLVLSARTADRTEPWSTNFDLYRVSADGSGAAENLTAGNPAWDTGAVFGDANTLYYRAMKRPGFEADRFGLMALDLATGERRETVHGYVVKPWNYEEGRKYPVAFLIHGGPQGSFGNGWSYRWNPQTYAGQGYAVVMIDFHGSTGYGQAFTDAISQHWGDRPLEDLQKGWKAALRKYQFLDGGNACALGASYGGYMVNWIAGNWHTPASGAWKCLVNHDGVFDTRMMGFVTEELWFTEWENGGTPWTVPQNYEQFNPSRHVDKWRVPMLVVHGEQDFRIPVSQGLAAFTALQRQGIESKFLYFPDENHWVLKPHNSVLWHDTVNDWLQQHLGQ